jgi:hypothetical protein
MYSRILQFIPNKSLPAIYLSGLFLGFHYFLTVYINSSFLEKNLDASLISLSYAIGAMLNIILLLIVPGILTRLSTKTLAIFFISLEFIAVYSLSVATNPTSIFALFILHQALAPIILYLLDIFLESSITEEKSTGRVRSVFLTIQSLTLVASLLIVSRYVTDANFGLSYILSALSLIPLALVIFFRVQNIEYLGKRISFVTSFAFLKHHKDTWRIIVCGFILQFFYAWMIIYLPLSLRIEAGFAWSQIGIILIIMIVPFALFEIPEGMLADKKFGEKEMLELGFIVMGLATLTIPILNASTLFLWAGVLFMTRVGASMVEVGTETYFFKKVGGMHSDIISAFRIARPLSFVTAPLIAYLVLYYLSYQQSFAFLGTLVLLGLLFIPKKDTR